MLVTWQFIQESKSSSMKIITYLEKGIFRYSQHCHNNPINRMKLKVNLKCLVFPFLFFFFRENSHALWKPQILNINNIAASHLLQHISPIRTAPALLDLSKTAWKQWHQVTHLRCLQCVKWQTNFVWHLQNNIKKTVREFVPFYKFTPCSSSSSFLTHRAMPTPRWRSSMK